MFFFCFFSIAWELSRSFQKKKSLEKFQEETEIKTPKNNIAVCKN
jgi:hypothetical protein